MQSYDRQILISFTPISYESFVLVSNAAHEWMFDVFSLFFCFDPPKPPLCWISSHLNQPTFKQEQPNIRHHTNTPQRQVTQAHNNNK